MTFLQEKNEPKPKKIFVLTIGKKVNKIESIQLPDNLKDNYVKDP